MLAVDMSNFTDPLSSAAIAGFKAAGVGHVIVQAVDPPPNYPAGRTRAQIQACLDGGPRSALHPSENALEGL